MLIIAESPIEARFLWVYALGGRLALPPVVTFIHGSPFQFDDEPQMRPPFVATVVIAPGGAVLREGLGP